MHPEFRSTPGELLLMALGVVAAIIVAFAVVDYASVRPEAGQRRVEAPLPDGVEARIIAGDITVERHWLQLNVSLQPGGSIDEALPPGPFEAEFDVRFRPGDVEYAKIGAVLQGGSVIIRRGEEVLLSDFVDAASARTILTMVPLPMTSAQEQLRFTFRTVDMSDGGAVRLEAIWQPAGTQHPQPIPPPR